MTAWTEHVLKWKDCQLCPLAQQRSHICLARGTVPCDVVFIGEAPGVSEDALGRPFVGPAGRLQDQIVERAIPPEITYSYTNLVACFPRDAKESGDNEPERMEIDACRDRLIEFVNLAQPKLIVCVGSLATQYIDHKDTVKCIDITHPAAILRMPFAQREMAAQRCIVALRNAVEEHVTSNTTEFQKWGARMGSTTATELRRRYDAWMNSDDDIPF